MRPTGPRIRPPCSTTWSPNSTSPPHTHIADLGCGPGTASIPLARRTGTVIALDPNTEMLQAARAAAQHAGLANIAFRHGHAENLLDLDPGDIEHVVFGRSFHWTDRAGGGSDARRAPACVRGDRAAWARPQREGHLTPLALGRGDPREVRETFLGPARRAGSGTYFHPEIGHEQVLDAGGFGRIERHTFTEPVEYDLERVLGLQRSYSHSAERLFGDRYQDYLEAVRAAVTTACGPGPYRIDKQDSMVIARRPTSS